MRIVAGVESVEVSIEIDKDASLSKYLEAFRLALEAESFSYVKHIVAIHNDDRETSSEDAIC